MRGNGAFARFAGAVALGGAFYTATYITSYPGGAPPYAVFALLAGTAGGLLACALPRSAPALITAAVLVGFGFSAAVLDSGLGFGPGLVLLILAARWARQADDVPHGHAFTVGGGPGPKLPIPATGPVPGTARAGFGQFVVVPEVEEPVVHLPEADPDVVVVPEAAPRRGLSVSDDGLVQAGPPGIIGLVGPPGRDDLSDGFR